MTLVRNSGAPEYAAAAYNAGQARLVLWKAERAHAEIPEFVKSIPFTQTREYIQVMLRSAIMYRLFYGGVPNTNSVSKKLSQVKIVQGDIATGEQ